MSEEEVTATSPTDDDKKKTSSKWGELLSAIGIIALAPLVALFLINFVFQSYQVDGPSMENTLQDGDRLIVTKTGKTWSRITGSDYIPKRYEIIIFNYSESDRFEGLQQQNGNKQLIKRVIGLPGDRVVVKDGVVTVYNSEHPDGYLVDRVGPESNTVTVTDRDVDVKVNAGEVFVMGDNRENSLDSRFFGPIKSKDIVGKLNLRIYPFDKAQRF